MTCATERQPFGGGESGSVVVERGGVWVDADSGGAVPRSERETTIADADVAGEGEAHSGFRCCHLSPRCLCWGGRRPEDWALERLLARMRTLSLAPVCWKWSQSQISS